MHPKGSLKASEISSLLTHFMSLVSFYTPRKYQKTRCFLMVSEGAEINQWHEVG